MGILSSHRPRPRSTSASGGVEAFPIADMVEGAVHVFGTDDARASVSEARIFASTNFDNCLDGEQIGPLVVVDGQVSGTGDVSVEGSECAY
jgi:hypothetical protein